MQLSRTIKMSIDSVGCIGAGAMSTALLNGLINAQAVQSRNCVISDTQEKQLARWKTLGVNTTLDNKYLAQKTKVIIIATKPAVVSTVLKQIASEVTKDHLLISIAAGVPLVIMEALLPSHTKVVRVMPNTPSLVGAGASAFSLGKYATQEDASLVEKMFSVVGKAVQVPEYLIDPVTGLSGSGPAYVFVAIEALADGGVRAGLPRDIAMTLAAQTVFGAAKMVLDTGLHPAQLKDQVCSPGGTTISGVHALEEGGFRNNLINAVLKASQRGTQLADAALQAHNKATEQSGRSKL